MFSYLINWVSWYCWIAHFLVFSSANCICGNLHWLPMKQQIQFKNLLLTYKSLHTGLASYLYWALVPISSPFDSTRRSSPANLILSSMTWNSSHTLKSQLNYIPTGIADQILFNWPHQFQLFVKGSKRMYVGKRFLLHRYTFLIGWISLDNDLFHYIRLIYTGCTWDYALLFYRCTIIFLFMIIILSVGGERGKYIAKD